MILPWVRSHLKLSVLTQLLGRKIRNVIVQDGQALVEGGEPTAILPREGGQEGCREPGFLFPDTEACANRIESSPWLPRLDLPRRCFIEISRASASSRERLR